MLKKKPDKYNRLKKQILELLLNTENLTSHDLQLKINAKITNICDCLLRLHKQGLVSRDQAKIEHPGRPQFTYAINQKGKQRLTYWSLHKFNENQDPKIITVK